MGGRPVRRGAPGIHLNVRLGLDVASLKMVRFGVRVRPAARLGALHGELFRRRRRPEHAPSFPGVLRTLSLAERPGPSATHGLHFSFTIGTVSRHEGMGA